jgi:urease accessory protein
VRSASALGAAIGSGVLGKEFGPQFALAVLLLATGFFAPAANAHESRPAYLEIRETAPGQYAVLWHTPVLTGMRLPVVLQMPDGVRNLKDPVVQALAWLAALWAQTAGAHVLQGEAYGFLTGFLHPITGMDHVFAMVAVGLWSAQLGAPAIWVLPVAFPLVMAMGGLLGFLGVPLPGVEYGIAASAILLGAAVAFQVRPPVVVAGLLVGFFAIFHGHAHGTELPVGQSALLYSLGFVIATGCLHALGIAAFVVTLRAQWARIAVGVGGSWIAASGLLRCDERWHRGA